MLTTPAAAPQENERDAANRLRERETAYEGERSHPELEHAESEGQPNIVACKQWAGASTGHGPAPQASPHLMPWHPGFVATRGGPPGRAKGMPPRHPLPAASQDPPQIPPQGVSFREPLQEPAQSAPRKPPRGASGPPPPFTEGNAGAAALPSPFAGTGPLQEPEADAQGDPSTSPCGPVGPLPEPNLGFDRNPVTPPSEPQSPLTRARSAVPFRTGLPSVKRLRVEAIEGRARSFTNLRAARTGAPGGLGENRQTWRARARSGELRSLMALHVYEHGVEEIAKVVT